MIRKARNKALSIGAKIHPLMGPIFTGRPDATSTGDPCAMCPGPDATPSDTTVRRRNGTEAYLCFEHDLMLHQAVRDLDGTMHTYEQDVLARILDGAERQFWLPLKLYARLTARAERWAHIWTLHIFLDLTQRMFEQREQRLRDQTLRLTGQASNGHKHP